MRNKLLYLMLLFFSANFLSAEDGRADFLAFIDGFSIQCRKGYSISDFEDGLIAEDVSNGDSFSIITPGGHRVSARILYDPSITDSNVKERVILTARSIFSILNTEKDSESIVLRYEKSGSLYRGYWVNLRIGSYQRSLFSMRLDDSPGHARLLFLYLETRDLPENEQKRIIQDVLSNILLEFLEAAG